MTPTAATKLALRTVAERQLALTAELTTLDAELDRPDRQGGTGVAGAVRGRR